MPIKFGTDGWRAIIAEDFTFGNVRLCAQGAADLLRAHNLAHRGFVIGYDTRFGSAEFAAAVAEVMTGNGVPALLSDRAAPTPTIAYNLVAKDAGAGCIITASHNPAAYNGFKYKPDYGGSASPEIVDELERRIGEAEDAGEARRASLSEARAKGLLEYFNPMPDYLGHIASFVDLAAIRNAGLDIIVDAMHGAGAGYFTELLDGGSTRVSEIRAEPNPAFPGMAQPEPLAHNLEPLMNEVSDRTADVAPVCAAARVSGYRGGLQARRPSARRCAPQHAVALRAYPRGVLRGAAPRGDDARLRYLQRMAPAVLLVGAVLSAGGAWPAPSGGIPAPRAASRRAPRSSGSRISRGGRRYGGHSSAPAGFVQFLGRPGRAGRSANAVRLRLLGAPGSRGAGNPAGIAARWEGLH